MKSFQRLRLAALPLAVVGTLGGVLIGVNTAPTAAEGWWQPGPLTSWAYVIGESYPLAVPTNIGNVQAYDADAGDESGLTASGAPVASSTITASVAAIHAAGAHAICYVDVGGAENYRSDYSKFDPSELGNPEPGWPSEKWLNVNDWSTPVPAPYETVQQIMTNRFALCKQEGFDAVEPDNDDAYANGNLGNFSLSMAQEETYVKDLASIAHSDGLAIFLKNGINGDSFVSDMEPYVDGSIVEQCWQYKECSALEPFVAAGKPVLNVEYKSFPESTLCPEAQAFPMATIHAGVNLTGTIDYGCWQYGSGATPTTTTTVPPATTNPPTTTTNPATTTTQTTGATSTTRAATSTTRAATSTTRVTTTTTKAPRHHVRHHRRVRSGHLLHWWRYRH